MTADRWRQIDHLFHRALALPAGRREAFLASACDGDDALREEVESLIVAHEGSEDFLETPAASRDPYVGETFKGRYRIERELGRGGIGVVYLAHDTQLLAKPVVVKVLLDKSANLARGAWDEWLSQKFEHEVEALARIDHPGVVGVLDAGEAPDGRPFFVMQYVDGVSLRSALEDGPMGLDRAAGIIRQIGQALGAAHERGVFHRDLKPENVLLQTFGDGDERVKVIDFGIAKVENPKLETNTGAEMVVGTVAYMSPEQLRSAPSSAATDVYAMGLIAFEMVTGRMPFRGGSIVDLADAQRAGPEMRPADLRPELSPEAEAAILKALAFDPADRHARARDLGDELARALLLSSEPSRTTVLMSTEHPAGAAAIGSRLEPVGGAVPLASKFYIVRPVDEEFRTAVARGDSIVLVKGSRQMGKTSLLARGLQHARKAGARVAFTDFQTLNATSLRSLEAFYLALGDLLAEQLDLETSIEETWNPGRSPNRNFERYIRREALGRVDAPVVWGLDEVDRLFTSDFGGEVFGLFRSWHNARSLDPAGPWNRLTLAIAYATEAHLFITDLNQSPFNVGTRLALDDFSPTEVAEVDRSYGPVLGDSARLERYYGLVGGHPYLVRQGLHEMAAHGLGLDALERLADQDEGPFGDHLRRLALSVAQDVGLADALRAVLQGRPCPTAESFYRLRSAGVISGDSIEDARPRCRLYAVYLGKRI